MKNPLPNSPFQKLVALFYVLFPTAVLAEAEGGNPFGVDMSIEGMRSQEFSVGMFYFLIAAIFVFVIFIFLFMFKDKTSKLKKGEKWLFAWLLIGVAVAITFGATQMLHGYLF